MSSDLILDLALVLIPLVLAITVHEYAHVAMAWWLGDDTGRDMGRLTLDPSKHVDPIWTLALPAVLVIFSSVAEASTIPLLAAGKPAPYNPSQLTRPVFGKVLPTRYAELLVAAAGPISNLMLAFISLGLVFLLSHFGYDEINQKSVLPLLTQFVYLNIMLFVFNLIPVPPLDGSKVLMAFLPPAAAEKYEQIGARMSLFLLAVLVMGGDVVLSTMVGAVMQGMMWVML